MESLRLQKALDAQMEERQKAQESDFKQFLIEKKLIDEIIAIVKQEERARVVAAMKKKQVLPLPLTATKTCWQIFTIVKSSFYESYDLIQMTIG